MAENAPLAEGVPVGGRRSRAVTALVGLVAAGFAVFALIRGPGLETGFPLVPLMAYTPYVAGAAVLAVTVAGVLRRWVSLAVLAVTAAVLVAAVLPRAVPGADTGPRGVLLRVATLNAHFGHTPAENIVALVREHEPDVLALQEVTPELAADLSAAGLDDLLPYSVDHSAPAAAGGTVHSVHPLTDLGDIGHDIGSLAMPLAGMSIPGDGETEPLEVEVVSVHPMSPRRPSSMAAWDDGLAGLPPAGPDGPLRILAGDFNATLDHAALRGVLDTGYRDAAADLGRGLVGTWPVDGPPLPPVTLDHVLVDDRARAGEFTAVEVPGSTHRALVVELVLPVSAA
ncbi:endonuclease/exonuclease/phosphatase family protein [Nocardiopsis sp. CC223A]|uniref:endonuclease/exonuclease/phosphatase family protein n=1 Tax=Nocardiopsis sp. CC223A TaxID=3044051 RepID=UPI00278C3D78|nr:endonuclease/exonuclease/phosphatase family protein [Nocardiopsis sp. CC223A]